MGTGQCTALSRSRTILKDCNLSGRRQKHQWQWRRDFFEGQVPLQIRRSGRLSEEGVALSMTQWYPKLCEYDFEGWHADAYIAREFHGVWCNFDVKISRK